MPDTTSLTGSRDDLAVEASRCLKMRFSDSSCRRCVDMCPHGAATAENLLAINPDHCRGCLLCTTVCPTGALELSSDFSGILQQLGRIPNPVLGCYCSKDHSNAVIACLGGLSEEHLLALCHTISGKMTLNMSGCSTCPNSAIVPHLHQRIALLSGSGLLDGGCRIAAAESAQDIKCHEEHVDRRSFFKSLRNSLFQSAAVMLSSNNQSEELRTEYAGKRVPIRRKLLCRIRANVSRELEERIQKRYDTNISCDVTCTGCHGCVAICPTGALQIGLPDMPPEFSQLQCTGCSLCHEFCLDGVLRISGVTSEMSNSGETQK